MEKLWQKETGRYTLTTELKGIGDWPLFYFRFDENGAPECVEMVHHGFVNDKLMEWVVAGFCTLKSIHLWPMTDERLSYLTKFSNVESADFRNTHYGPLDEREDVTDEGLEHLSQLHRLKTLYLSKARISDAGLKHLKRLTNLKILQVDGTFTLAGLQQLSCTSNLVNLEIPNSLGLGYAEFCPNIEKISSNGISDFTDSDLAYLKGLTKLIDLTIVSDKVTDNGVKYLMGIKSLRQLTLFCPNVTEVGIEELRKALPQCRVEYDPTTLDKT